MKIRWLNNNLEVILGIPCWPYSEFSEQYTLWAMADGSGVNMRNNIEMRDTEFFIMISPKTAGNYLKCILACFRTED